MCINPRYITRKTSDMSFHKAYAYERLFQRVSLEKDLSDKVSPFSVNVIKVNCGKCVECLKARQNDLASRVSIAAKEYGSMHFITLTYDEDLVPLSARPALVDIDTGEVILDKVPVSLVRLKRGAVPLFSDNLINSFRDEIKSLPRTSSARVLFKESSDPVVNGLKKYYYITPSLHRRDVRMWIKSSRVDYERKYGKKLSDFKYVLAGEFGPNTCRPHYHLILLGLSKFEVLFLLSRWKYGYTKYKKIPAINADGSSGFVLTAKYISKYIVKGDFEADCVKNGYVERPRVCLSRYIGTSIPGELVDYYRCTDVFGRYNLDTLQVDDGSRFGRCLSLDDLCRLYSEVRKRSVYRLGLSSWLPLPKVIMKKLFSVDETYYNLEKFKYETFSRQSILQMAFASFVESDFLSDYIRKLRSDKSLSDDQIVDKIDDFLKSQKAIDEIKDSAGKKDFQSFYAKSHF